MAAEQDNPESTRETGQKKTAEDMAKSARDATEETAETGRRGARAASEATQRSMEAAQRATDKAADTVAAGAQRMSETASRMAEETADQMGRVWSIPARASEQMSQQTSENIGVMMDCGTIVVDGMQSIWREWINFTQGAVQRNVDGLNQLMSARTMQDLFVAQSDLLKSEMELLLNSGMKITEVSSQIANQTSQRIAERGGQQQQQQQQQQPQQQQQGGREMRRQSA